MEYFAGLDVSMEETHICVVDRDGAIVFETQPISSAAAIAEALGAAPTCTRVVFETGRMAPMLFHGLAELKVPVICIESRQAYQALKTLTTHKTDRNDARSGAAGPDRFLQGRAREVAAGPCAARADRRPQEARRPACHAGEPDPGPGGGIRRPPAAGGSALPSSARSCE